MTRRILLLIGPPVHWQPARAFRTGKLSGCLLSGRAPLILHVAYIIEKAGNLLCDRAT
jgi:hypothetical protein